MHSLIYTQTTPGLQGMQTLPDSSKLLERYTNT